MFVETSEQLAENMDLVLKLEQELKINHSLSRKFLREGELLYGKNKERLTVWIFNDLLVGAQKRKNLLKQIEFVLKVQIPLPNGETATGGTSSPTCHTCRHPGIHRCARGHVSHFFRR